MVPLAIAFQQRGHRVAWVTSPDALPDLRVQGFELFPAGLAMDHARRIYHLRWLEVASLRGELLAAHTFPKLFGGVVAPAMIADLEVAIDKYVPDLVINEPAALAMPLVCQRRGVKYVTHAYGLSLPQSQLTDTVTEFSSYWHRAGIDPPKDAGVYRHLYIDIAPPSLQIGDEGNRVRSQLLCPSNVRMTQALPLPNGLRQALNQSSKPKIYLTFGTVFNQVEALRTSAIGLSRLDAVIVVTVGRNGNTDRLARLPANVYVERYVDQASLLKHCDVIVSHAGSGTMLGAAAHGIPQILLPQAADQFRNARALATVGAGVVITQDQCTAEAVEAAALSLLTSAAHSDAARRLADEIQAMPTSDEVVTRLEKYG